MATGGLEGGYISGVKRIFHFFEKNVTEKNLFASDDLRKVKKMAKKTRLEKLQEVFEDVDESQKTVVENLISEVVFLEGQMDVLRKLPFVSVHPNNPSLMKQTPAAKLYKECSQSYMNAIRILLSVLKGVESAAQDELLRRLEEFS